MRVLVCGSRDWTDGEMVETILDGFGDLTIIEGCARGADAFAHGYQDAKHEHYPAGSDPLRRNREMLAQHPDLVIAFKDGFGTQRHPDGNLKGGTEHMIRIAKAAGIPVWLMQHG